MCNDPPLPYRPVTVKSDPPSNNCNVRLCRVSQCTLFFLSFTASLYSTYPPWGTVTLPFHTSPSDHVSHTPFCAFHLPSFSVFPTTHTWSP